jgi:SpoVK/Ycf46/Vps4 family AAA+-type ATPase
MCVTLKLTEYELCIASNLVDPLSMVTDWNDIGGLAETIQEIKETIIMPFQHHSLFVGSGLVQPPKGFTDYLLIYAYCTKLVTRSAKVFAVTLTVITAVMYLCRTFVKILLPCNEEKYLS